MVHPRDRIAYRTEALKHAGLWREPADGRGVVTGGIDTRSNDYLGLASRSPVSRETGTGGGGRLGAGASRVVSGSWEQHELVEGALAEWLGVEACLMFSSGYAANVGALSALVGPGEVVISDALNHASIIDGCRLSRARTVIIPHGDVSALERALADTAGVRWVVFESYYGMDGDSPDLQAIGALCAAAGAALIVDEAHALGVFGPEGRGLCAERGVAPDVLVGGLGKAFGAQGGFVATSSLLRDWLWNRARSFVFSTGASPLLCELILDRLAVLRGAKSERARLRALEAQLEARLRAASVCLPAGRHGPIFPVVFGSEAGVMAAARVTSTAGVRCQPIRPPTVPAGGSRLRVILNAGMAEIDVDAVADAVVSAWRARDTTAAGVAVGTGGATDAGGAAPHASDGARERPSSDALSGGLAPGAEEPGPASVPGESRGHPLRPLREGAATGASGGRVHSRVKGAAQELTVTAAVGSASAIPEAPLKARCWVVLGVGTGVGKTYVSRALVEGLARRGAAVAGLKPVETGVEAPGSAETDAATLTRASLHVKHPQPHPLYAFRDPVTPALAARREHVTIDLPRIRAWIAEAAPNEPGVPLHTVIETAGGVFSPLSDDLTNLDLAIAAGDATWLLVAADRLGTLHDVAATLRAMRAHGASPDHLILSAPAQPDESTGSNAAELRRMRDMPPIVELPRGATSPLLAALLDTTP